MKSFVLGLVFPCALGIATVVPAHSQTAAQRPMALEDIVAWKGVAGTALSENGDWLGYRLTARAGDGQVVFHQTRGERQLQFPLGEQPELAGGRGGRGGGAGANLAFSSDGHYAAFLANPTHAENELLRRQHRPIETHVGLVNLATGVESDVARVRRFAFSGDNPDWIALQKLPPVSARGAASAAAGGRGGRGAGTDGPASEQGQAVGTDLILRRLSTGEQINIGNVNEFAFDPHGKYLAWTVDAQDQAGNGVQLRDLASGATFALDSDDNATYAHLNWNPAGTALAVLKGAKNKKWDDKLYQVLGFTGFGATPRTVRFDPLQLAGFPAGMTVSPERAPEWTEDLAALTFGIHTLKPAAAPNPDADPNDKVNLVIWNYQDPRLQSEQIVEQGADKNYSYLAEFRIADGRFLRLADDSLRSITVAPHQRFAVGSNAAPYQLESHLDGQRYADVYAIDMATGARRLAVRKCRWLDQTSPDGTRFAFYRDGNYWVYDMTTNTERNVSAGAPVSFIDTEDDHNVDRPPVPMVGWSSDSRALLLSDNWDIWKVPAAVGAAVNLTGDGRKNGIRYRHPVIFNPDASGPGARGDNPGYDLAHPLYLDAYGEWTKKDGIAVITPGQNGATRLAFDEASYAGLMKAAKADVYLYTRQTFQDPPDYYATASLSTPGKRITDLGAQQAPFLWSSGTLLVNYTSTHGDRLQGALHLPANYVKGKQYPTIVFYYEKTSQNAYTYIRPTANGFSISAYNSNGYAVFDPDITYKVNDPGMSAVGCLVPAVQAAIATGVVDPRHIGIHGHSWGGYQTAFAITQTNLFAAAVAGAPLTDMISMYDLVYKNTGVTNGEIFEASQGRFTSGPWDNWAAYTRNSPVAQVKNVTTPLLMLSDDTDGAVDFTQGMEYFNALRRLGKPVVLLEYPGENHSLARLANQKDYTVRMKEFFDHYLKGAPLPAWYAKGVPHLAMDDYLQSLQAHPAPARAAAEPADRKGH